MTTSKQAQIFYSAIWNIAPKTKSLIQILTVSFVTMLGFALSMFLCNVIVPFLFALVAMAFTAIVANISGIVLAIVLIAILRKMILR